MYFSAASNNTFKVYITRYIQKLERQCDVFNIQHKYWNSRKEKNRNYKRRFGMVYRQRHIVVCLSNTTLHWGSVSMEIRLLHLLNLKSLTNVLSSNTLLKNVSPRPFLQACTSPIFQFSANFKFMDLSIMFAQGFHTFSSNGITEQWGKLNLLTRYMVPRCLWGLIGLGRWIQLFQLSTNFQCLYVDYATICHTIVASICSYISTCFVSLPLVDYTNELDKK